MFSNPCDVTHQASSHMRLLSILSIKLSSCSGGMWGEDSTMPIVKDGMIVKLNGTDHQHDSLSQLLGFQKAH